MRVKQASPVATPWLPYPPAKAGRINLYCLPHAGAGASTYLGWRAAVPAELAVIPLQPPGREMRMREQPHDRLEPLLDELVEAMSGRWLEPFALFGHSMGALIAFGLARRLRAAGQPQPVHLFVSGRRAPGLPEAGPWLHELGDGDLVRAILNLGSTPERVLAGESLRAEFLKLLRADLALNETYAHYPEPLLDLPLTAFGGTRDPKVSPGELMAWRSESTVDCAVHLLPGGHFYLAEQRDAVLGRLLRELGGWWT